jgi:lipoate-protein ligase A
VLRRASGGASIVAGPGCLMYALILDLRRRPQARAVDQAHRLVLGRLASALAKHVPGVCCRGTSDLALGDRKFSGNSMRIRREHVLYHGTLLYAFDCGLIAACLKAPPRMPAYRQGRSHADFVTNVPLDRGQLIHAVCEAWSAMEPLPRWPRVRMAALVEQKYSQTAWNLRF